MGKQFVMAYAMKTLFKEEKCHWVWETLFQMLTANSAQTVGLGMKNAIDRVYVGVSCTHSWINSKFYNNIVLKKYKS